MLKKNCKAWLFFVLLGSSVGMLDAGNYFYYRRQNGDGSYAIELWPEGSNPGPHSLHCIGPVAKVLRDVMGQLSADEIRAEPVRDGNKPYSPGGDTNVDVQGNVVDLSRVDKGDINNDAMAVLKLMAQGWHNGKANIKLAVLPGTGQISAQDLLAAGQAQEAVKQVADLMSQSIDKAFTGMFKKNLPQSNVIQHLRDNPQNQPSGNLMRNTAPGCYGIPNFGDFWYTVYANPDYLVLNNKDNSTHFWIRNLWRGQASAGQDSVTFDLTNIKTPASSDEFQLKGLSVVIGGNVLTNAHNNTELIPNDQLDAVLGFPAGTNVGAVVIASVIQRAIGQPLAVEQPATAPRPQQAVQAAVTDKALQDIQNSIEVEKTAHAAADKAVQDSQAQLAAEKTAHQASEDALAAANKKIAELTATIADLRSQLASEEDSARKEKTSYEAKLKADQDQMDSAKTSYEAKLKAAQDQSSADKTSFEQERQSLVAQREALAAQKAKEDLERQRFESELAQDNALPLGFRKLPGKNIASVACYVQSDEASTKKASAVYRTEAFALMNDTDGTMLRYDGSQPNNPWVVVVPVDADGKELDFKRSAGALCGGRDVVYALSDDGKAVYRYVKTAKKQGAGEEEDEKPMKKKTAKAGAHKKKGKKAQAGKERSFKNVTAARSAFNRVAKKEAKL